MVNEQAPFFSFDNRAKRVVVLARQQAEDRQSEDVAPAHLLLALLAVRRGLAARAVASLCGSCTRAEDAVAEVCPTGRRPSPAHLPFTAATDEAVVRAARQAQLLGDDHIGTEHLLLGVLASTDNAAVGKLAKLGVNYDGVRTEIGRLRAG